MMAAPKRLARLPMAAFGVLLACALAFLYAKTQEYDPSTYFERIALLRHIKQLDARWELDAMKSKVGINQTYDPLVDPLMDLHHLQQQLKALTAEKKDGTASALDSEIENFERVFQKKAAWVEHFKSHNAVLRNSMTFLPTAADDVHSLARQGTGRDDAALRRVSAGVNKVLLATLVYDHAASEDKRAEIEAGLRALAPLQKHLPADIGNRLGLFIAHVRTVLREHGKVDALLKSIAEQPTAAHLDAIHNTLNMEQQRSTALVQQYRQYLLIFAAALIGLFLYAAARLIRSNVVIQRINTELQHANDTLEHRVEQRSQELKTVQAELVTAAREAGMAEVATDVLHNVGNVLNSVNVSAGLVSHRVRTSKAQGLEKVVQLLNAHTADLGHFLDHDPKGKMLPDYLGKLSEALVAEQKAIVNELAQLSKSVDHIKDIVATQQSYAGVARVLGEFRLSDLIDDALRMCAGALSRHHVTVVKEFSELPPMLLDRHRVLQILINLINNSKNAMGEASEPPHQITVRLRNTPAQAVQIQVQDNGEGIAPDNLTRIFAHGFTTRKEGHGFGLHSCILASREMGGSLTVHSDGVGRGATFTFELPTDIEVKKEVL